MSDPACKGESGSREGRLSLSLEEAQHKWSLQQSLYQDLGPKPRNQRQPSPEWSCGIQAGGETLLRLPSTLQTTNPTMKRDSGKTGDGHVSAALGNHHPGQVRSLPLRKWLTRGGAEAAAVMSAHARPLDAQNRGEDNGLSEHITCLRRHCIN